MLSPSLVHDLVISCVLFGVVGWLIGRMKGRPGLGALLGVLLGLFGVVIIAVVPSRRRAVAYTGVGYPPAAGPQYVPPPTVPAQWAPDPAGRHEYRWWDGKGWTNYVSDGGVESVDADTPG